MAANKSMKILIVDDFKSMTRIVRNLLEQLGFTNVEEAPNGDVAYDMIKSDNFGLVLSDWNMQPTSGLDLLKMVRADPSKKSLPFVMVTAEAKPENVATAKAAGADGYIIKPFTLAVLKQKLSTVVGEI